MFKYISIGKVLKPQGIQGEMLCAIEAPYLEDLKKVKAIFLKIDGLQVPFFIEHSDLDSDSVFIKVEELNAPEEVREYNGEKIFLREEDISDSDEKSLLQLNTQGLSGYTIIDKTSQSKFTILDVQQFPQQLMAIIKHNEQEILIPLIEEFILSIHEDNQLIEMQLPEGLLDI